MNTLSNQLNKSVIPTNILDMDYDDFMSILEVSLELLLGEQ